MILKFEDIQFDENNASGSGYGVGASVGYGFNQHLTLMINAATLSLNDNDARMNQLELLGRYHLGKYRIQPFMETSVMGSLFKYSNNKSVVFSGLGIGVGGGIRIAITDQLSLESGYRPVRFDFSKVRIDNRISDIDRISTTQFRTFVGLSLYLD
jgi:opacity protein-like surface antigen